MPQPHNQQHHDRACDPGQRDVPHPAQVAAAVDHAGFVQFPVDAADGRQENDGVPADILPQVHQGIDGAEGFRLHQEILPFPAKSGDQVVDNTAGWRQELHHHTGDNHAGYKIWKIGDRLGHFFEPAVLHLIKQRSQDDGRREIEDQVIQVDQQRVAHQAPQINGIKELLEKFKSHPWTFVEPQESIEIFESDRQAQHRRIAKYDIIEEGKKYSFYAPSTIVLFIQSAFLIAFIVIWYIFKFIICYQLNVMKSYNEFFVFRKKKKEGEEEEEETDVKSQILIDYFKEDTEITSKDMFSEVSKNLTTLEKIYIAVVKCSFNNREINMFIFSLFFNILFICTQCYIFLTIPILFIANIIPTLFDIFFAMKTKFLNMLIVLIFEYFLIYIFMWITYFYLPKFLDFDEVLDPHSLSYISEKYCYSSLQCYMMVLNYGSSAGGGLGDVISIPSYRTDVGMFVGRFFYDMFFFILIVLVMGNIFLGIIVDAFGELLQTNIQKDEDIKNICFICQLSRDDCLSRNIDFDEHVSTQHNKWNYVYFLTYLQINNPNDFSGIENSVWEKLEEQDFGWIPLED